MARREVADDGDDGLAAALDDPLGSGGDGRDGDVLSRVREALPPPPQAGRQMKTRLPSPVPNRRPSPESVPPKSKAVPPPSLEAEVGLVVKEEGATRTQDKENSAQRPRGSPAHDLGACLRRAVAFPSYPHARASAYGSGCPLHSAAAAVALRNGRDG